MRKSVRVDDLTDNMFRLIGDDWMLVTAGPPEDFNTMTASWGGFGVLWNRNVCWCVIRPQRYTFQFMERYGAFTLSFFTERYRSALELCGTRSGRDLDKAKAAGLSPEPAALPCTTTFAEARLVLSCRKLYSQDIDPARFVDPTLEQNYPNRDYHRMYFGQIEHVALAG
jgi:flavin reductase (DIM6/NTAB) family NADH-FMN oxidoreductase RutF